MAELVAGSEEAFVELMNNKASDLGLKNTNFKNPTGLDAANHYSTAYDMSLIAQQLVKHPKILELTGTYEDYLRVDQKEKFWLVNTNKLVRFYQGVDGLKTGYTEEAGYCLTTTATRNGMRLITVVMGEPDTGKRSADTSKMLDYGFNMYEANKVLSKSTVVGTAKVEKGNVKTTQLVPTEDIILLNKKASSKRDITYELKLNHIKAPVTVGDKVGLIKIIEDKKIIKTIDLTVNQKITKIGIFKLYMRHLEDIFSGNIKF